MTIPTITQEISSLSPAPNPDSQTFEEDAQNFLGVGLPNHATELETVRGQINATVAGINEVAAELSGIDPVAISAAATTATQAASDAIAAKVAAEAAASAAEGGPWTPAKPATYSTPSSFVVTSDLASQSSPGMRIKADCGADGTKLGTVASVSGTTVSLTMDGGGVLTSNLVSVMHGNDNRDSLVNHADQHALDGRDSLVRVIASTPGHYARDVLGGVAGYTVAADRRTLLTPNRITCNIADSGYYLAGQQALDLNVAASWDSTSPDYRVPANRAGKDFYVYACIVSGALKLLVSANATYPSGFDATTSRKIGGFHCLCVAVGIISGHTLSGYLAGDILPASVWDLKHRPVCAPEGMVYVDGLGKWVDIYLASVSGGKLVSAYNATCADGTSSPAFHWYKFSQWLGQIGKRMPTQTEFVAASLGSNQGTNITGSADPGTTGGKSDTAGRRMISNVGCEDCCGNLWQWVEEAGGGASSAAWVNAFDGNDSGVAGQHYQAPNRAILGGGWNDAARCGSRALGAANGPLGLDALCGVRGVAEPLAIAL